MELVVVFDNWPWDPKLETGHGLAVYVKTDQWSLLFDTGSDARILSGNLERLGIEPKDIDYVFISHDHWDHTGGLDYLEERNPSLKVLEGDKPGPILPGAMSTGLLEPGREKGLILETRLGPVLLVGCSHPGITKMAKRARELTKRRLYLVLGGFHLMSEPRSRIEEIVREMKELTQKIAPCHCSGEMAREIFKKEFREDAILVGAGYKLVL